VEVPDDGFVLTPQGFEEIQRELNEILTVKRPRIVERIREARQLGDISENSDYEDAKHVQALLEARLKELKAIIAHAAVIEPTNGNGSVGIGSRVTVKDLEDGAQDEYTIVGPAESSPNDGKISNESCVGKAMMGMKVGDTVCVKAPGGDLNLEILSVS